MLAAFFFQRKFRRRAPRGAGAAVLAFYEACWATLDDDGVMAVNLFGNQAHPAGSLGRIAQAFGGERVRALPPTVDGNTIVLACKSAHWPDEDELAARARWLHARWRLPAMQWLELLRAARTAAVAPA